MKHGIYFIQNPKTKSVKIGKWSGADAKRRLNDLQIGSEYLLEIAAIQETESDWHAQFEAHWIRGEWFKYCPEINDYTRALNGYKKRLVKVRPLSLAEQYKKQLDAAEESAMYWKVEADRLKSVIEGIRQQMCVKCHVKLRRHEWYISESSKVA